MPKKYKPDANQEYFAKANLSAYVNEWVAISGSRVVAHGKYVNVVYKQARRKKPRAQISLAKILPQKPLILSFMNGYF